jgi:phospholipid-binding lipoprotein MlaA
VHHFLKSLIIFSGAILLQACQSSPNSQDSQISDPYEGYNRSVFAFNNTMDAYLLEPVAIGYNAITPAVIRLLIRNEIDYFQSPVSIINSALQGDLQSFLHTSGRFFLNTTFGGLGLLDAASGFGLKPHQEDFGQTLAVWGVPNGVYYMAPFLGPLTLRDLGGRVIDTAFTPTTYMGDDIITFNIANMALGITEFRASNIDTVNNLKASSSDYYAILKTIYIQRRNAAIKNTTLSDNVIDKEPQFINFDEE